MSEDDALRVGSPGRAAGGLGALVGTARQLPGMGVARGVRTLARLNQPGGFDCPGCAWPEPEKASYAEFCENGAKHVAHEATLERVDSAFFRKWSIPRLLGQSDRWLEAQGRLVEPLWRRAGSDHYEPVAWADAYARIATALRELGSPDEAVFYTSGRTSNEAAFLYQLFARRFGTNNLPDCSNMCHESSGTGLSETIGVGKGTVALDDFERADLILVMGQNPGSNHPRMLTTLESAAARGCHIVSVNPLRELGLVRFAHPKDPLAMVGRSRPLADIFVQLRVGGDVALLQGVMKELLALEAEKPGEVLDTAFIERRTRGFDAWRAHLDAVAWDALVAGSGVSRAAMRELAERYAASERVIVCWAMGLTQHRHGVANVQEIVNLLLLRGNLGKPGAGVCPVRGHSNVQGDRTMGIWERPKPAFLDRLAAEFGFEPPRAHGVDTVGAIDAMREGRARVFVGLGGNFAVATPDTELTHAALSRCALTVQISTKLNRSHLVTGREAIVLPCLGRTERDDQPEGPQFVTVEDSMSVVHASQGQLEPASPQLRSEPRIVAELAEASLGSDAGIEWNRLAGDYDEIRERIARVVPGFEDFNRRVRVPGGFVLPSGARTGDFETPDGRALFAQHALPQLELAPGQLMMMTVRSHDQFNTSVYSDDDRYRGIGGSRRVVLVHADDIAERALSAGQAVDITSHFETEERVVRDFKVVPYEVPRGCVATYFPEANGLVPLRSLAAGSRTPAYKSVAITLAPSAAS